MTLNHSSRCTDEETKCHSICEKHARFNFLRLPQELQAHVLSLADARTVWQVAKTCHALHCLCLSPGVLSAHIPGWSSPLAASELFSASQDERSDLLNKTLAVKAGRCELAAEHTPEMRKAHGERQPFLRMLSPNCRFEASVTRAHLEIWDTFYDRCTLQTTLDLQQSMRGTGNRPFVSLGHDFVVVFANRDGSNAVARPTLSIEIIQLAKNSAARPARVSARRTLHYGVGDTSNYQGWYTFETKRIGVVKEPHGCLPPWPRTPGPQHERPSTRGFVHHWHIPAVLTAEEPDESFDNLGGFNQHLCTNPLREWYMFMLDTAKYKGIPGVPIQIPAKHLKEQAGYAKIRKDEAPKLECTFIFADAGRVTPSNDVWKASRDYARQSLPRDRTWYFYIWDAIRQRAVAWPGGSVFQFTGPDRQRIDYFINEVKGIVRIRDPMGNCWTANRGSAFMKVDDHPWKPSDPL